MSKQQILANIRRGLGRGEATEAQRAAIHQRLNAHKANLIPKRAQLPHDEQIELFKQMATEAAAELYELNSIDSLPEAVSDWLTKNHIKELVSASDPELQQLDWSSLGNINRVERVAQAGDMASLTTSFAGIAETGTLMLHSRTDSPTTLNFLPDIHMVTIRKSDIVGPYEDAWQKLREVFPGKLPRTVNMITGPSRSADIEQRLQMGAHGPRTLVIYMINS